MYYIFFFVCNILKSSLLIKYNCTAATLNDMSLDTCFPVLPIVGVWHCATKSKKCRIHLLPPRRMRFVMQHAYKTISFRQLQFGTYYVLQTVAAATHLVISLNRKRKRRTPRYWSRGLYVDGQEIQYNLYNNSFILQKYTVYPKSQLSGIAPFEFGI